MVQVVVLANAQNGVGFGRKHLHVWIAILVHGKLPILAIHLANNVAIAVVKHPLNLHPKPSCVVLVLQWVNYCKRGYCIYPMSLEPALVVNPLSIVVCPCRSWLYVLVGVWDQREFNVNVIFVREGKVHVSDLEVLVQFSRIVKCSIKYLIEIPKKRV